MKNKVELNEQVLRGLRIKNIRENELRLNKTDLAKRIGVSSQFLSLVESGKGNLTYKSLKNLRDISSHSADFILYGLDDNVLDNTKAYLEFFSEDELKCGLNILKDLVYVLKNKK